MKNGMIILVGALALLYFLQSKTIPSTTTPGNPLPVIVSNNPSEQDKRTYLKKYYNYYIAPGNNADTNQWFGVVADTMADADLDVLYMYVTQYLMVPNIAAPASVLAQINQVATKYQIQDLFI